jgi:hypothetical protein
VPLPWNAANLVFSDGLHRRFEGVAAVDAERRFFCRRRSRTPPS